MEIYSKNLVYTETLRYFKKDDLATKVWIDKYALKDKDGNIYEKTPDDMHRRISREFARIESKYKNSLTEEEIYQLLKSFKYIVPQGSPMFGIGNDFALTSLSNCFVVGSNNGSDSYGSIMRTDEEQVQLMKRRGGVGHDISHLRPSGAMANNSVLAGMAGSTLYMERYSNSTREVSQGDRRGALMLSIDVRHPDVDKFIDAKLKQGRVTGANISVKITDKFMEAVKSNGDFLQTFPIKFDAGLDSYEGLEYGKLYNLDNGGYMKRVRARDIWDKIIQNAHASAEPGVLFWDKILSESPADCYEKEWKTVSTNPCFTGDTMIAVADGRNGVSIKELSESGDKFLVYCARKGKSSGNRSKYWKTEIKRAKAFKTGNKNVVEIFLSDGSSFKCTPDHRLALPSGKYVEAKDSLGLRLEKFYTFSNKNTNKSYRHINSKTDGHSKQYRKIWDYHMGEYDGRLFNIDHIDSDSKNDFPNNLQLLSVEDHKKKTKRKGSDNPIMKIAGTEYLSLYSRRANIAGNGMRYGWDEEEIEAKIIEFDLKYSNRLEELRPKDINVDFSEDVYVEDIIDRGFEDVYDITVEDNHNFYIITKSDDDRYMNCSGVLVHNCGEIPLCPYDSCRLLALNLYSYVSNPFTEDADFNYTLFSSHVNIAQRLMDDIVDLEIEKINKIILKIQSDPESDNIKQVEIALWQKILQKAIEGRRTGLGITGEGDMLAALGLRYGSDDAIEFSEKIHEMMAVESYRASIRLAEERGAFPIWSFEKERENPFISRIIDSQFFGLQDFQNYKLHGRRNISNLTIAPTGTTSLMTQTTSGLEPVFLPYYKRRRKTQDETKSVFVDEVGDMWEEYTVFHHKFVDWFEINYPQAPKDLIYNLNDKELKRYVEQSPYYGATSADVDYLGKVRLQGKVQRWVDHSISVTVNMPEDATIETVAGVYELAHEVGCKGMTIYRDGSRSGVLISETREDSKRVNKIYNDAIKRPHTLQCDVYNISRGKQPFTIVVGLLNEKPYEIFALEKLSNLDFSDKITKGELKKVKSKTYELTGLHNGNKYVVPNIIDFMSLDEQKDTRKYSLMLRHGIRPKFVIEQINEYATISSFDKVIAKALSNYLNGETVKQDKQCPNCHSTNLKNETGCVTCLECGWSKCG